MECPTPVCVGSLPVAVAAAVAVSVVLVAAVVVATVPIAGAVGAAAVVGVPVAAVVMAIGGGCMQMVRNGLTLRFPDRSATSSLRSRPHNPVDSLCV